MTKKDSLTVRIDQSGKFSAMTLLRAMDPKYVDRRRSAARVLRNRNDQDRRRPQSPPRSKARSRSTTWSTPASSERAGEIIIEAGQKITKNVAETICTAGVTKIETMEAPKVR